MCGVGVCSSHRIFYPPPLCMYCNEQVINKVGLLLARKEMTQRTTILRSMMVVLPGASEGKQMG